MSNHQSKDCSRAASALASGGVIIPRRLDKFLADATYLSRREINQALEDGRVTVESDPEPNGSPKFAKSSKFSKLSQKNGPWCPPHNAWHHAHGQEGRFYGDNWVKIGEIPPHYLNDDSSPKNLGPNQLNDASAIEPHAPKDQDGSLGATTSPQRKTNHPDQRTRGYDCGAPAVDQVTQESSSDGEESESMKTPHLGRERRPLRMTEQDENDFECLSESKNREQNAVSRVSGARSTHPQESIEVPLGDRHGCGGFVGDTSCDREGLDGVAKATAGESEEQFYGGGGSMNQIHDKNRSYGASRGARRYENRSEGDFHGARHCVEAVGGGKLGRSRGDEHKDLDKHENLDEHKDLDERENLDEHEEGTAPWRLIFEDDAVFLDGERLYLRSAQSYYILNKPGDILTATRDPHGRSTLAPWLQELPRGVFPVGRLDRATTGLLLLSDDGDLGYCLLRPWFGVPKEYHLTVRGEVLPGDVRLAALLEGVDIGDEGRPGRALEVRVLGRVAGDELPETSVRRLNGRALSLPYTRVSVVVDEGRNRLVRRMARAAGFKLVHLHRHRVAGVEIGGLGVGEVRRLSGAEVSGLWEAVGGREAARLRHLRALRRQARRWREEGRRHRRLESWLAANFVG